MNSNYLVKCLIVGMLLFFSCGADNNEPPEEAPTYTITIHPAQTHQQMIGFGGALTWYSNWMTSSSNKTQIADLIFTDLGIDIVRFKNWYYPDGYPTTTSTSVMTDDNSKLHWDATNELFTMLKERVPSARVLLSSWGPPSALKSNGSTRQGTLKKDAGNFMYNEFGDYWVNVLDHLTFNPDYISIQNEPTYINAGWTTCEWAATETASLPGYVNAFDNVFDKIKNRANQPIMIGPESQDIATFSSFATLLKDKAHCGSFAYHPYNFNSGSTDTQIASQLQTIAGFNTKPNVMTEYSDNLDWFRTANFIQSCLVNANSSGYIYWKLVWATPTTGTDAALVSVTTGGQYTVTPYFHLLKHFSRDIDAGYARVEATSEHSTVSASAFINPASDKLTVILINTNTGAIHVDFDVTDKTISGITAVQSKVDNYYKVLTDVTATSSIKLQGQSITTVVLDI
ncbi:MAG TPA: hypothetical protein VFU05_00390 [Cyclobacteriaceae bacterium]|nr:hypothetical protein [Cyclobacteriaceae bacterium]